MSGRVLDAMDLADNKLSALLKISFHWMVVRKGAIDMIKKLRLDESVRKNKAGKGVRK